MPKRLRARIALGAFFVFLVTTGVTEVVLTYFTYQSVAGRSDLGGWLNSWTWGWTVVLLVGPVGAGLVGGALAYYSANWALLPLSDVTRITRRIGNGAVQERVPLEGDAEITALALAVNGLAEKFQYIDEHRRSLLAEVTHELRRPLSNVQGYAEIVQQQVLSFTGEIQESASAMQRQVETLARQIDGLRILADADSGDLVLNPAAEHLADVLKLAVEGYETKALERGIVIVTDVSQSLPMVIVDRHRIYQVVGNLMDNAIAHMPSGGEIRVTASRSGRNVQVMVKDTGTGIPDSSLPHIFERFYSGDPIRSSSRGGFGLGLTVSKHIVEMHGGQIWAESQEGKGSTFYFTLPTEQKPERRLMPSWEAASPRA